METATEQLHEFLEHVVLENCLELFGVQDQAAMHVDARLRRLRLLNAVWGLDRAVYQAFFAQARLPRFDEFLADLVAREPALAEVRELSNALKKHRHGVLLADERLTAYLCAGTQRVLESAFEFWLDYSLALGRSLTPPARLG